MPSNALTQKTITSTISKLQGGSDSTTPNSGVSLIDDWLKILEDSRPASAVQQNLMQLRSLLQLSNPDTEQLKTILNNLADETVQIAQSSDGPRVNELEEIVRSLRVFSNQL